MRVHGHRACWSCCTSWSVGRSSGWQTWCTASSFPERRLAGRQSRPHLPGRCMRASRSLRRRPHFPFALQFLVCVSSLFYALFRFWGHKQALLSRLPVLLERRRLPSLSISSRSCARGVALSMLKRMGLTSVEMGRTRDLSACWVVSYFRFSNRTEDELPAQNTNLGRFSIESSQAGFPFVGWVYSIALLALVTSRL